MAEKKPNSAPRRIHEVLRTDTPSGVTHVRAHHPDRFTVVGNHLVQHPVLSLTAIGLAAHILSLPEGAAVDIRSLAERFPEGRDRIAFALRELETHGYLRRVRERTESGRIVTRTYAHHLPVHVPAMPAVPAVPGRVAAPRTRGPVPRPSGQDGSAPQEDDQGADRTEPTPEQVSAVPPVPPVPPAPSVSPVPPVSETPVTAAAPPAAAQETARTAPPGTPAVDTPPGPRHDKAVALLASLRRTDDRLTLSRSDVYRLAPAVTAWFDVGATAATVHHTLTAGLPTALESPAALVAYRLRSQLPLPFPTPAVPAAANARAVPRPHPLQDCDGCGRVFRAPEPGQCRDCRSTCATPSEVECAA
ncbi:helix-turn-helix domain-containing protein [Streptomyces sp. NPDC059575]|uniref:helix-turn-helix domain-containing protein n=1 Tax=Streptomyces sp. NPDC059575 TaxID=3346872 RepID=UPI00368F0AD8